jgi:hypothetical protein
MKTDLTEPGTRERARTWVATHRWKLGLVALTFAGFWWRRHHRKKAVVLTPVSEDWLERHEVEAGKSGD